MRQNKGSKFAENYTKKKMWFLGKPPRGVFFLQFSVEASSKRITTLPFLCPYLVILSTKRKFESRFFS